MTHFMKNKPKKGSAVKPMQLAMGSKPSESGFRKAANALSGRALQLQKQECAAMGGKWQSGRCVGGG